MTQNHEKTLAEWCDKKVLRYAFVRNERKKPWLQRKEKKKSIGRVCMFVDIFSWFQLPYCRISFSPGFCTGFQAFNCARKKNAATADTAATLANRWKIHFPKCCRPLNLQEIKRNQQNILCDVVGYIIKKNLQRKTASLACNEMWNGMSLCVCCV